MANESVNLANDYAAYMKVDMTEELKPVFETVEDILTRLEEFESLLSGVHNGGTSGFLYLGPEVKISCQALDVLFNRVDRLEKFVQRVKTDVTAIESRLDAAEASSSVPLNDLKSFFRPLFSKKADPTACPEVTMPTYEPPEIFKTEEFFPADKTETDK